MSSKHGETKVAKRRAVEWVPPPLVPASDWDEPEDTAKRALHWFMNGMPGTSAGGEK